MFTALPYDSCIVLLAILYLRWKGVNIRDTFTHGNGIVANGDTGDVVCDSYHRYRQDILLLQDIDVGMICYLEYLIQYVQLDLFDNYCNDSNASG